LQDSGEQDSKSRLLVNGTNAALERTRQHEVNDSGEKPAATPPRKILKVRPDGKLASPKRPNVGQDTTPPKKMLRVRSDGKLGSPNAKEPLQGIKPKRARRSALLPEGPKTLVAKVKYGVDDKIRSEIGGKIDDIWSGEEPNANLMKTKALVPSEPPKVTHPFFLGSNARTAGRKSSMSYEDLKDGDPKSRSPPAKRNEASPRTSRVTSKPSDVTLGIKRDTPIGWNTFGSDARVCRFPGAMEPIWPPYEMLHIGQDTILLTIDPAPLQASDIPKAHCKLKDVEVKVPVDEEVLKPCLDIIHAYENNNKVSKGVICRDWRQFRRPLRRLMNGTALQRTIRRELGSRLDISNSSSVDDHLSDELGLPDMFHLPTHKALENVYRAIATSLSAFDRFECETQEWVHKYAPKTAEDVLQSGRETTLLRDWLRGSTTNAVEIRRNGPRNSPVTRQAVTKANKRKRKRAEELNDFIISSDEEANEMDELADSRDPPSPKPRMRRSLIRSGDGPGTSGTCDRSANAVVISGPHGCGKTAAVYAVAQELGFEIFEINAGSRRSGRDILDKVGDMTRNHLVGRASTDDPLIAEDQSEELELNNDSIKKDIETGRQGTMNNFFKAKTTEKKLPSGKKPKVSKASPKRKEPPKRQKPQKQSLILLEEVDVLFEDDKQFWTTTLSLVLQSKRPVIMTCTDERLLPLNDMILHAILRFSPPPAQLATDYLMLVACNEGHLLPREAMSALYSAKGLDLRASISELNFFCQMAIGDEKGGLDWMLIRPSPDDLQNQSLPTRVVSENTYENAMGWLSGEVHQSGPGLSLTQETELLSEVWNGWGIDLGAFESYSLTNTPVTDSSTSTGSNLEALQNCDLAADALSAADTLPACVSREPEMIVLDTAIPVLTDKIRVNYTEGSAILLADPFIDHSGVVESLVLALRACARRLPHRPGHTSKTDALTKQAITSMIQDTIQQRRSRECLKPAKDFSAFEPIARSSNPVLGIPKGPQITSFDGPITVIVEDLAPYIRSIVSYDLRLEEQRRQLSGSCEDGRKTRTTRSSRAALEGGQKAYTRRERWFPNDTSFELVLRSGGTGWQAALQRMMTKDGELSGSSLDGSTRSSAGSIMENDI